MAYEKQTWNDGVNGGTPVNAQRLRHMEQGITDAHTLVDEVYQEYVAGYLSPVAVDQAVSTAVATRVNLEDIPGQVTDALTAAPTVVAAAEAQVTAVLNQAGVMRDAYPIDSDSSGWLYVVHDSENNVLLGINRDGYLEAILGDAAQVPFWTALVENPMNKMNALVTGYMYAITDEMDNILFGIRLDGTVEFGGGATVAGVPPAGSVTVSMLAPDTLKRLPLPQADYGAKAGLGRNLHAPPLSDVAVRALVSTVDVVCWGDSMTDGWPTSDFTDRATMAYPGVLDSLLANATVHNAGSTGQSADEIALRQGGLVLRVTVTGGEIPASGGVTVTVDSTIAWRLDRGFSQNRDVSGVYGTLAGVPGRMTRSSSTLTFTRTTAGSAVPVTGAQRFVSSEGEDNATRVQILFAGRNDIGYSSAAGDIHDRVVNAYIAMVEKARLHIVRPRILIAGVLTASGEKTGSGNHTVITRINATLETLYPDYYARDTQGRDFRGYLVNQAIHDLGITPTATDLDRIAGDTLPPSIMASGGADSVHYSVDCAAEVAAWWKDRLVERGWAS